MYPVPENETERLRVLHSFARLDATPEQEFDDAAALAAEVCRTPMALVSIIDSDRQWFKARVGLEQAELPRRHSFCTHALLGCRELVVPDAHADRRFAGNPLVLDSPHIRFYAGVPLNTHEGATIGVLCVMDREPRELDPGQMDALHALARQVMAQLELKRGAAQLARTELAHADAERTRQELSRLLVEQSGDGLVAVDEQGVLQVFNPEAQRQHGLLPGGIACTRWAQVLGFTTLSGEPLPPDDAPLCRALQGEQVRGTEWAVRRADGSVRLLSGNATPLRHPDGRLAGAVLISRDVTEQRHAEQALQEAVHARDEFLSIASHELRTPLSTLSLQASGLLRALLAPPHERPPEARLVHKAESLKRQVDRLEALVSGLLDVSRLSRGTLDLQAEEVDLREVATELVEQLGEAGTGRVRLHAPLPVVGLWDRLRLEQVLTNLVSNALRYGGSRPVEVRVEGTPEVARLEVRDEGIGIPEESQERIFGRFERAAPGRNYGGLGLGLWLTRQLVEAMDGQVQVQSRPHEGATFVVELPRH